MAIDATFLENALLNYLEKHPEIIERLSHDLVTRIMEKLEAQHGAQS